MRREAFERELTVVEGIVEALGQITFPTCVRRAAVMRTLSTSSALPVSMNALLDAFSARKM